MEEKEFALRQATNEVTGVGYLKEFSLDYQTTENNVVIKGTITVAVDEKAGYKLKIYCPKKKSDGTENSSFAFYDELIKNAKEVNSVVNVLNENPEMDITVALNKAKRLFVRGGFAPFEYLDDNDNIKVNPDIKATYVGDAREDTEFNPGFRFKCEFYISGLKSEKDENGNDTERGILVGSLPLYGGDIAVLNLIIPEKYKNEVLKLYNVGDTARIYGELNTIITEEEGEDPSKNLAFGVAPKKEVSIKSRTELIICGGDSPYGSQNEKAYKKEDIENARAEKVEKLQKNKEEYGAKKEKNNVHSSVASAPIKQGFKFE